MSFQISFLPAPGSFLCAELFTRERSNTASERTPKAANLAHTHFFCNEQSSLLSATYIPERKRDEAISKSISFYKRRRCQRQNPPLVAHKPPLCDRARTKTNTRPPLVPGDPQDVRVKPINSTSVRVDWKPPLDKERNGLIRGYHVHVQEIKDEVRKSTAPAYTHV
jgi:Fibronectin type III domain